MDDLDGKHTGTSPNTEINQESPANENDKGSGVEAHTSTNVSNPGSTSTLPPRGTTVFTQEELDPQGLLTVSFDGDEEEEDLGEVEEQAAKRPKAASSPDNVPNANLEVVPQEDKCVMELMEDAVLPCQHCDVVHAEAACPQSPCRRCSRVGGCSPGCAESSSDGGSDRGSPDERKLARSSRRERERGASPKKKKSGRRFDRRLFPNSDNNNSDHGSNAADDEANERDDQDSQEEVEKNVPNV